MRLLFFISLLTLQLAAPTAFAGYFDARDVSCQSEQAEQEMARADIQDQQGQIDFLRACQFSSDCLPNENCIRGQCVPVGGGGSCLSDVDCAIGEHCLAGRCVR